MNIEQMEAALLKEQADADKKRNEYKKTLNPIQLEVFEKIESLNDDCVKHGIPFLAHICVTAKKNEVYIFNNYYIKPFDSSKTFEKCSNYKMIQEWSANFIQYMINYIFALRGWRTLFVDRTDNCVVYDSHPSEGGVNNV